MAFFLMGITIAYEAAILSFIKDTPFTTGSDKYDLLLPAVAITLLSCAPDLGFLAPFSALGLLALAVSFVVIAWQGVVENGASGFAQISQINLWPEDFAAVSDWFGIVAFGYGVAPIAYNIRESMAEPQQMGFSTRIALWSVFGAYAFLGDGVRVLFSPSHDFDGDVLQAIPTDSWIPTAVRLLMTFVSVVTAPLLVVPCGELLEGKLGLNDGRMSTRVLVRAFVCAICAAVTISVPSFVYVVSFVGCFCVALVGFVLPPLFHIQLTRRRRMRTEKWSSAPELKGLTSLLGEDARVSTFKEPNLWGDGCMLVIGTVAMGVTSVLTFCNLLDQMENS